MIKSLFTDDEPASRAEAEPHPDTRDGSVFPLFDSNDRQDGDPPEEFVISRAEPQPADEIMRQSGLAWSAGVAFFAAVVFMLVLGWGADLLLGTSPWGIVGGIVLGSAIGFIQFFRLSSQIFKK